VQILHSTYYLPENTLSIFLSVASSLCEFIKDLNSLNKLHHLVNFAFESINKNFFYSDDILMSQLTQNFELTFLS